MNTDIKALLQGVQDGSVSVDDALLQLKQQPFHDLGYAKVDLHRKVRQGANEVIYGAGKTPEQIIGILEKMSQNGQKNVLITRLDRDKANLIQEKVPLTYYESAQIAVAGEMAAPGGIGTIVVATGGTSDIPVAEEAALTAEFLGNNVVRLYDVGVAGIHRLLNHSEQLMQASVVITSTGMPTGINMDTTQKNKPRNKINLFSLSVPYLPRIKRYSPIFILYVSRENQPPFPFMELPPCFGILCGYYCGYL